MKHLRPRTTLTSFARHVASDLFTREEIMAKQHVDHNDERDIFLRREFAARLRRHSSLLLSSVQIAFVQRGTFPNRISTRCGRKFAMLFYNYVEMQSPGNVFG